jgi:excisionase family DNA binding protein
MLYSVAVMVAVTRFLSTQEAGRLLGVSSERVRQLSDAGALKSYRTSLGRLYPVEDVQRLLTERKQANGGGK